MVVDHGIHVPQAASLPTSGSLVIRLERLDTEANVDTVTLYNGALTAFGAGATVLRSWSGALSATTTAQRTLELPS